MDEAECASRTRSPGIFSGRTRGAKKGEVLKVWPGTQAAGRDVVKLHSPVAQGWSIRLLTEGLLVRVQPGEPYLTLIKTDLVAFHLEIKLGEGAQGHFDFGGVLIVDDLFGAPG